MFEGAVIDFELTPIVEARELGAAVANRQLTMKRQINSLFCTRYVDSNKVTFTFKLFEKSG
jgi:precorrin-4 methylase